MTNQAAIKSFEKSNEQAKVRLEVEKMRMDMNEVKELEFYIERDEMAIKALEQVDKINEIIEPLRHLSIDEMSDIEWQILQVIDKYRVEREDKG